LNELEKLTKTLTNLDKTLHEKTRLAISTILFHRRKVDFNTLRRLLETSEGNLATHLRKLEQAGYIEVEKRFVGRKPKTLYQLTEKGRKAYRDYLTNLRKIIITEDRE